MSGQRWPAEALSRWAGSVPAAAEAAGLTRRTGYRWAERGALLDDWTADRAAVALGLHPAMVWPGWFAEAPVGSRR